MILYRWTGVAPNFGDELNTVLWPRLLPGFFDDNKAVRFLGIGSVLDQRHPAWITKLVAGSGYAGYERKPRLDRSWDIKWVRGPRTATALGLPAHLALGDPAMMAPRALGVAPSGNGVIGFMPHFESALRGAWQEVADRTGVVLIDPRAPPLSVLHAISRCRVLLSEALHGVIVADAMRVPWVAIRPLVSAHRAKWLDWAESVSVTPRFHRLPASSVMEWAYASPLRCRHTTRGWLARLQPHLQKIEPARGVARASQALRQVAQAEPQLSPDAAVSRCQSRMIAAVHALSLHPNPLAAPAVTHAMPEGRSDSIGAFAGLRLTAAMRRHLQRDHNSAYQLPAIGLSVKGG